MDCSFGVETERVMLVADVLVSEMWVCVIALVFVVRGRVVGLDPETIVAG